MKKTLILFFFTLAVAMSPAVTITTVGAYVGIAANGLNIQHSIQAARTAAKAAKKATVATGKTIGNAAKKAAGK